MEKASVISVNPGVKTLGELNISQFRIAEFNRNLAVPGHGKNALRDALYLLTGVQARESKNISAKLLSARILLAIAAFAVAIISLTSDAGSAMGWISTVVALSSLSGVLCRISCISAAAAILCTMPLDITSMALAIAPAVIAILGPGRLSGDALIRKTILRAAKSRKEKQSTRELNYRAYFN